MSNFYKNKKDEISRKINENILKRIYKINWE